MRKISMKRKSKAPVSDVPEDDKSDESIGSNPDQDADDSFNDTPPKKGKKGKRASKVNEENGTEKKKSKIEHDDEDEEEDHKKNKKNKRASKANEENGTEKKKDKNKDLSNDEDEDYEADKIVGDKMIKGVRHFLIRWKGHDEDNDTWEPENMLNCNELIKEYFESKGGNIPAKYTKKGKPGKEKKGDDEKGDSEVYEVDKIIEVHFKKNGRREFLVHWKGYSATDNTWEPEEHMNCPDLIERFMNKVEQAKSVETKELRVKRKPTDRFDLLMTQAGRKLSRRNQGKQRVHYYDAE